MMIFMGVMFYHVAAGLCVYFIASSLWGIGERKLLDWTHRNDPINVPPPDSAAGKFDAKPTEPRVPDSLRHSGENCSTAPTTPARRPLCAPTTDPHERKEERQENKAAEVGAVVASILIKS